MLVKRCVILAVSAVLTACSVNQQNQWTEVSLLKPRYGHVAVTDGTLLYNIGGTDRQGLINDAEVFDPATGKQWKMNTTLLPRRYFSAVYDGEHSVYLLGGNSATPTGQAVARHVEQLDLKTGQAQIVSRMPATAAYVSAVMYQGEILVFGGIDSHKGYEQGVAEALAYNPKTTSWRTLQPLSVARATRAVVHEDWVYLVGGYDGQKSLTTFERYNPKTNSYQSLPALPQKISAHSASVVKNKLVVFGDYDERDLTYSYDFSRGQWQKIEVGFQDARHTASAVIGDVVYVTGGTVKSAGSFLSYVQRFQF